MKDVCLYLLNGDDVPLKLRLFAEQGASGRNHCGRRKKCLPFFSKHDAVAPLSYVWIWAITFSFQIFI